VEYVVSNLNKTNIRITTQPRLFMLSILNVRSENSNVLILRLFAQLKIRFRSSVRCDNVFETRSDTIMFQKLPFQAQNLPCVQEIRVVEIPGLYSEKIHIAFLFIRLFQ
jgi:hypothetical protein